MPPRACAEARRSERGPLVRRQHEALHRVPSSAVEGATGRSPGRRRPGPPTSPPGAETTISAAPSGGPWSRTCRTTCTCRCPPEPRPRSRIRCRPCRAAPAGEPAGLPSDLSGDPVDDVMRPVIPGELANARPADAPTIRSRKPSPVTSPTARLSPKRSPAAAPGPKPGAPGISARQIGGRGCRKSEAERQNERQQAHSQAEANGRCAQKTSSLGTPPLRTNRLARRAS